MAPYELPEHTSAEPGFLKRNRWWLIPLVVADVAFLVWWFGGKNPEPIALPDAVVATAITNVADAVSIPGLIFAFPTSQTDYLATNTTTVFMPTGSGRPESAHYGSVRTSQQGKFILPSFHEGIDIAPTSRDRKQIPVDQITAAADGRVLYVNRIAGNSNYGRYIVLGHDDPVGEIYTLYAHLEEVESKLKHGLNISRGEIIGRMGNSASTGLPLARAHLHFEVGMINNLLFHGWFKRQKLKPDHGNYHGHNLTGIQPLDVFRWQEENGSFSMKSYLDLLTPAFTVAVRSSRIPDYFRRYPSLWSGGDSTGGAIVINVSEGGVPQSGRPATADERTKLGLKKNVVLSVNDGVLGRNGLRMVTKKQGQWVLGKNGERWLEILMYH